MTSSTTGTSPVHAFSADVLGEHDATGLAALIRAGEISAAEAVEAAIRRSDLVEARLTALERTDHERARARARQVRPGAPQPLAGVPTLFKDNVPVAGLPMTNGSQATPRTPIAKNGKLVDQILHTGVIPIGISRMPEFGWTPTTERADGTLVRNPWHPDYSAGGSSGGSAAYVAAGVVPIAHGNDGGGSIRIPAAVCGLVGHKPTRGRLRLSEAGAAMPVRIVSDGVLTRSVRDVATFFAAAEQDWQPKDLPPMGLVDRPIDRPLRIGVQLDSPFAAPSDAETRSAATDLAHRLEALGHHVEPHAFEVPPTLREDFLAYWSFLAFLVARTGPAMFGKGFDRAQLDPMTVGLARDARRVLHKMPLVIRRLRATGVLYDQTMADWDLVLTPTLAHTTPRLGVLDPTGSPHEAFAKVLDYVAFTPLHNAAGAPAISLPTGRTSNGLPLGVMLSAKRGADELLLRVALQIEQDRPFARIHDVV